MKYEIGGYRLIRFLVFSDLHYDHVFDANKRIDTLIDKINGSTLHFAISLGDLCYPIKSNKSIIDRLRGLQVPVYYCVGNHDCENYDYQNIKDFFEFDELHYSFVIDDTKFIVLNSCFMEHDGKTALYNKEKHDKKTDIYPLIPESEIEWLIAETTNDALKYIIFSHHSLANDFKNRGIHNKNVIRDILEKKSTLLCMNGHDHGDNLAVINEIPYFTVNSASYIWHGIKSVYSYEEEIHKQYPFLKDIILYKDPLHCIVEIDDETVKIYGMNSDFQRIRPEDVGINDRWWNGVSIEPKISDLTFPMASFFTL